MKTRAEVEMYKNYIKFLKSSNQQPCYNNEDMKDLIKYYSHMYVVKVLFVSFLCLVCSFLILFILRSQTMEMVYSGIVSFVITMFLIFIFSKNNMFLYYRAYLYSDTDISKPENISYELFYDKSDSIWKELLYGMLAIVIFLMLANLFFENYEEIYKFIKLLSECNGFIITTIAIILIGIALFMFILHFYKRRIYNISKKHGV